MSNDNDTRNVEPVSEHEFQQELILALGRQPWARCWRQNTGQVTVRDARGREQGVFRAGPPKGAADVSGIVRPWGFRLEVECKRADGERRPEQFRWADMVRAGGGVYVLAQVIEGETCKAAVARTVAEVRAAVEDRVEALRAELVVEALRLERGEAEVA